LKEVWREAIAMAEEEYCERCEMELELKKTELKMHREAMRRAKKRKTFYIA
jgi:hypothetical protein